MTLIQHNALCRAAAIATASMFFAACASGTGTTGATGGGSSSSGASSSGGSSTSSGGSSGGATGDNTKNTATIQTTDDGGKSEEVKVDKQAAKTDVGNTSSSKNGATNADKELILHLTSGTKTSGKVISVHIKSDKHQLPKDGIPVGEALSDAWVSYSVASATGVGNYESKDKGTISIDSCPQKEGTAIVGKLNNVVVYGKAVASGPKSFTLNGTFNIVYWGGAGALNCKPASSSSGGSGSSGASSSSGGSLTVFKKPATATCDHNPCDGGSNSARNCCPYMPCLEKEWLKCGGVAQKCLTDCISNPPSCAQCQQKGVDCFAKVPTICEVDATCKSAMTKYSTCDGNNQSACKEIAGNDDDKAQACVFDKCCAELKAAF